ncbi:MAG: HAMP domain-containing sensor histidine kinase, partial [Thiothrix litoralis]
MPDPSSQPIHREQVKLLYRNLIGAIVGNLFVVVIMTWVARNALGIIHWVLLGGMVLVLLLRYLDSQRFKQAQQQRVLDAKHWERRFRLGIFLTGLLWGGIFSVLFDPRQPDVVVFVVCFYAGLISAASATSAARFPVFVVFLLSATLPLLLQLFLTGSVLYSVMGVAFVVFMVVSVVAAFTYSRIIHDSIQLRFEKLDLITRLEQEKSRAEESQRIAEQAMRAKDKFLAAASHDLRQPLHTQGLYLDAIESYVQAKGVSHLAALRKTNAALSDLFNSLLDVSRLNAGIVEAQNRHVCLHDILLPLHDEFKSHALKKGLGMKLSCENLPVFTDPVLLGRILRNLLTNAIHYTREGGITLSCHQSGTDTVQIEVADT